MNYSAICRCLLRTKIGDTIYLAKYYGCPGKVVKYSWRKSHSEYNMPSGRYPIIEDEKGRTMTVHPDLVVIVKIIKCQ